MGRSVCVGLQVSSYLEMSLGLALTITWPLEYFRIATWSLMRYLTKNMKVGHRSMAQRCSPNTSLDTNFTSTSSGQPSVRLDREPEGDLDKAVPEADNPAPGLARGDGGANQDVFMPSGKATTV
jgi:hypothetical protein